MPTTFDFSRVLKPYHGVRILETHGSHAIRERCFFPIDGAARPKVADFDRDGDLEILTTSTFADLEVHPERGITFLENAGRYAFRAVRVHHRLWQPQGRAQGDPLLLFENRMRGTSAGVVP
jgi:hypothetical protein